MFQWTPTTICPFFFPPHFLLFFLTFSSEGLGFVSPPTGNFCLLELRRSWQPLILLSLGLAGVLLKPPASVFFPRWAACRKCYNVAVLYGGKWNEHQKGNESQGHLQHADASVTTLSMSDTHLFQTLWGQLGESRSWDCTLLSFTLSRYRCGRILYLFTISLS